MKCTEVRARLFRKIDGELSESENRELDDHIERCPSCARELRLTALPSRMGAGIPQVAPSPFFYNKLILSIEKESQGMASWQLFLRLSRQMVPALAGITLALLTALAFLQFQGSNRDVYPDYRKVFITEEQSHRMLAGDQADITDASVLRAIADRQTGY